MNVEDNGRIYNIDRKYALRCVEEALAEGRIDFEDFEELSGIISSTDDKSQLDEVVRKAQTISTTGTVDRPAQVNSPLPAQSLAVHNFVPADQVRSESDWALLSNVERRGVWFAQDGSSYRSFLGEVVLDLREAQASASDITLTAEAWMGNVCVVVCPGVRVVDNIRLVMSSRKNKAAPPVPGAATVRLEGLCVAGTVKIISRQPGESLPFGFIHL